MKSFRSSWATKLMLAMLFSASSTGFAQGALSDTLPNLIAHEQPTFPLELRAARVTNGYAIAAFSILRDRVDDAVILEASHLEFGDAVLAVLPSWRFKQSDSSTLPRREVLRFQFSLEGVVTSLSRHEAERRLFPAAVDLAIRTVTRSELSAPPERIALQVEDVRLPVQPGTASVSFVIDTAGHVRVPVVLQSTNDELGVAVLALVKQWRFAPVMHQGVPVLVEDLRSFTVGATP